MNKLISFFALAFAIVLIAQSNAAGESPLDKLKAQFLPAGFSGLNFTTDEAKKILREKCRKVSGDNETVFLQAHRGAIEFMKCISSLANVTAMQEEIDIAKPIGELDTVFTKYCEKKPLVEKCFNNLIIKIKPCLNEEEKAHNSVMVRIATRLLGFLCHKGGDQVVLFVAEQGPECLEENKENINFCVNSSFANYFPKNGVPDVNNLPQFVFGKQECLDLQKFEKCVLSHLEKCNDITPSNIIESGFKFLKNETACHSQSEPLKSVRGGSSKSALSFIILSLSVTLVLRKFFYNLFN